MTSEGVSARVGAIYRSEGITFGWHNHDFEFVTLPDGKTPHEHMFKGAPLLDWEMDIAWVIRGGGDPVKLIKKYAQTSHPPTSRTLRRRARMPTRMAGPMSAMAPLIGSRSWRR